MLLRICKRRSAWEAADPETIVKTEFIQDNGDIDLTPSVFIVEPDGDRDVVQIQAEYGASNLERVRSPGSADVAGLFPGRLSEEPGETKFRRTREAHRSITFGSEEELRAFVGALLSAGDRLVSLEVEKLLDYAAERLEEMDAEWLTACAERPGVLWIDQIRKLKQRKEKERVKADQARQLQERKALQEQRAKEWANRQLTHEREFAEAASRIQSGLESLAHDHNPRHVATDDQQEEERGRPLFPKD